MFQFFYIFFLTLLITTSGTVFAQEATSTLGTSSDTTEMLPEESITTASSSDPGTPTVPQVALQAVAQQRITNLAANMSNRMESVARRFEQVANRIDSRIQKVTYEGGDATRAAAALTEARTALAAFTLTFANIDKEVADFVGSPYPREEWSDVRTTFTTAREHLITAHIALKTAVTHLSAPTETTSAPTEPTPDTDQVTE